MQPFLTEPRRGQMERMQEVPVLHSGVVGGAEMPDRSDSPGSYILAGQTPPYRRKPRRLGSANANFQQRPQPGGRHAGRCRCHP